MGLLKYLVGIVVQLFGALFLFSGFVNLFFDFPVGLTGLIIGILIFICGRYVSNSSHKKKKKKIKKTRKNEIGALLSHNFYNFTPFEFEEFIGQLFKRMGYNVDVTRKTMDYGIDVLAKKEDHTVAIQVKQYAQGNNVGARDVQQILGAMWKVKANQAIIITTSGFTIQAREQAKDAPVELWGYKVLNDMVKKYFVNM